MTTVEVDERVLHALHQEPAQMAKSLAEIVARAGRLIADIEDLSKRHPPKAPAPVRGAAKPDPVVSIDVALMDAAERCAVPVDVLRSPTKERHIVSARRATARDLHGQGYSLPAIGAAMHRHHTTILHHIRSPRATEV